MTLIKNKPLLILSVLLAIAYLGAGSAKLAGAQPMQEAFTNFGYPLAFMYFIGLCEVAGAIGLFIKKTSLYAAMGLAIIMAGAVGSHLLHDPLSKSIPAAVLLILCAVAIYLNMRASGSGAAPVQG